MKNSGTLFLVGLTLLFVGFVAGMLVGRNIENDGITIQTNPPQIVSTKAPAESVGETQSQDKDQKININTAHPALLDTLPGIGPVLAQRIIDYREEHGPFQSISELSYVEGIGTERMLVIYDLITVEDGT